jgi:hypothetical protein
MHRTNRSKSWILAPLTIALVVATTFTPVHAAGLEGKACKVSGQTQKSGSTTFACLKKGSKLVWQKYTAPKNSGAPAGGAVDIKSGQYLVGSEIKPGFYRTSTSNCYYSRLRGFSSGIDDIISNGSTGANGGAIEILATDKGFSSRCTWYRIDPNVLATPTATKSTIASGMWFVGAEVKPGIYRTAAKGCYYSLLSGFQGEIDDIIVNGSSGDNGGILEITATDKAISSRCDWALITVDAIRLASTTSTKIGSGQWIVGGEIAPGTYRTTASGCYYSRLSGFRGDIDDIIANGSTPTNGGIVEIAATDLSFSSRCSWSKL